MKNQKYTEEKLEQLRNDGREKEGEREWLGFGAP